MSIVDRSQKWTRWSRPQTIDQASIKKEDRDEREEADKEGEKKFSSSLAAQATRLMHGRLAFDTVKSFFGVPGDTSYKSCRTETSHWKPDIEYHDSVTLGQVMFDAKMAKAVAKVLREQNTVIKKGQKPRPIDTGSIGFKSLKQPRAFVPLVPGLVHSLESLGPLEKSEGSLQIRLSPSPKNLSLPVPVKALPDLEICISFDEESKTTSIKEARLVSRNEKDFLQPQNIVDLRFIRERRVYAKDDSIDPRIATFVQNSDLPLWGPKPLKTPLGLSLSIPALAIQPHKGFDPASCDALSVDYTYLGLEHRSRLTIPYGDPHSWPTLTYTDIEAGPIGGRRDELSLHSYRFASERPPSSSSIPTPDHTHLGNDTDDKVPLSEDDHVFILFLKTATIVEGIERTGREDDKDRPGLRMPEFRRFRRTVMHKAVRKVDPARYFYPVPDRPYRRVAAGMEAGSVERGEAP